MKSKFLQELIEYAKKRKWKILIPFILFFVVIGLFLILVGGSAVIPIIYTIF